MFRRIVLKSAYMRRKMFEELLESVPLLQSLNVRQTTSNMRAYTCMRTRCSLYMLHIKTLLLFQWHLLLYA